MRYTQAFLAQVSQTAACNSLHTLEQRLPWWLLETQERIGSDSLPLPQEFIATMLGVRRAGVTLMAQKTNAPNESDAFAVIKQKNIAAPMTFSGSCNQSCLRCG